MNAYFELSNNIKDISSKYFAVYDTHLSAIIGGKYTAMKFNSARVWIEEDDGAVRYLRNVKQGPLAQVNMKEFMWIKLKSIDINDYIAELKNEYTN